MPNHPRRANTIAVHSVDRFVFSVPDLAEAKRFYDAFGLDVREEGESLTLRTFDKVRGDMAGGGTSNGGGGHVWAQVFQGGTKRKFEYVTFGIYPEDEAAFVQRIAASGLQREAHPLAARKGGIWFTAQDGLVVQLLVAPKVSPGVKSPHDVSAPMVAQGNAPSRSKTPRVHPRHLSHILFFVSDVPAAMKQFSDLLGIRLSDHSGPGIAFMHGAHGSDHHLVAFAHSDGLGLHHSSWDVGSINEVGAGAEFMKGQGYERGWGVGRHVLGSNYFYYVRDPWGGHAEYSFDIDFIPAEVDWPAADHPPEDSLYVWGPALPPDFIVNYETAQTAAT